MNPCESRHPLYSYSYLHQFSISTPYVVHTRLVERLNRKSKTTSAWPLYSRIINYVSKYTFRYQSLSIKASDIQRERWVNERTSRLPLNYVGT